MREGWRELVFVRVRRVVRVVVIVKFVSVGGKEERVRS